MAMVATLPASVVGMSGQGAWGDVGTCPNETLRPQLRSEQLPDCRAYERVTPAYKESEPALLGNAFAVSPDGSRLINGNIGAFGGAEQANLDLDSAVADTAYLLERSANGWTAVSLAPRASDYASTGSDGLYDASTGLSSSLWELGLTVGGAEPSDSFEGHSSLYLEHNPVAGSPASFEKIGSPTPNLKTANLATYDYLGASSDLSHVLFSILPGYRWSFDKTIEAEKEKGEGGTLYEYTGTESPGEVGIESSEEPKRKPMLVGVNGGLGSTTLISTCGTRLGSSSPEEGKQGSLYNAISASGERIFFTAVGTEEVHEACEGPQWGELYAREEAPRMEGELPAVDTETIPISEPMEKDCRTCITTENSRAPAVFQGASADGSKVFFTTEQELLPGAKGENLYEFDFEAPEGERVTLVSRGAANSEVQGVARISEDGSHVYFVAQGDLTGTAANGYGEEAKKGEDNLYVYREGHISFIADLVPGSKEAGGDEADWKSADSRPVLASEEGRFLVFTSTGDLTHEGVERGKRQVFQYDASTETLVRASIGQNGYENDNRTPLAGASIAGPLSSPSYVSVDSPASTAGTQAPTDGAVFFSSPDPLAPGALEDKYDIAEQYDPTQKELVSNVYEYRAGQVYLLSDGQDRSTINGVAGTALAGWDSTGQDVFFFTSDPLIPADEDTQNDLYDARENGGFPTPIPAFGCSGETCQGGLTAAPMLALPQSNTQAAEVESSQRSPAPSVAQQKPAKHQSKSRKKKRGGSAKNKKKARSVMRKRAARATAHRDHISEGRRR
jgi:hypothetical protein